MKTIVYISAVLVLLCGQAIAQSCTEANQLSDCTNPNLPLCVGGVCAACSSGSASACDARYYATPVCDTTSGACVACTEGTQCDFDPNRPICLNTAELVGCYECANVTGECYNRTAGAAPFCYTDGHCGGCASDFDCLMLFRSNAFTCNSDGVCEVPVVGPYMIATFVIIGFVILVFIIVISVVASKNKKNRQKRKNREAAKSERKIEMQPLRGAEVVAPADPAPRKSVDKPRVVTKEGDKENLMTGAAVVPKEKKESSKSSSSSASSDSSSTSESPAPAKPVVPAAVVTPVTDAKENSASSSVSGRSRSSSASSSSSESTEEKKSSSGSSVSSS
jgi:hypothetical protein